MKYFCKILFLVLLPIFSFAQRGSSNGIKWTKLKSSQLSVNPQDSLQSMSGQEYYVLQIALSDTNGVNAFRVNANNNSLQPSISNVSYNLSNQKVYRSPKNGDYIVYINLGSRPVGSVKNGNVQPLDKNGNTITGTTPKPFSKP